MAKNDFRVTCISLEFLRTFSNFVEKHLWFSPKNCLFIVCIFYLNEGELIYQVRLRKNIENGFLNSTSHESKTKEEDQKL